MSNQLSLQEIHREAETIRSTQFAFAIKSLFSGLAQLICTQKGLFRRARTVQRITEFDDNWLAEIGMRHVDIPADVAAQVNPARKAVVKRRNSAELRDAA